MVGQNYQYNGYIVPKTNNRVPNMNNTPTYQEHSEASEASNTDILTHNGRICLIFNTLHISRKCTYFYRFVSHLPYIQHIRCGGVAVFSRFSHASGVCGGVVCVGAWHVCVVCREVRACGGASVWRWCFWSWCIVVHRCGVCGVRGEGMTPLMRTLHIDQGIY